MKTSRPIRFIKIIFILVILVVVSFLLLLRFLGGSAISEILESSASTPPPPPPPPSPTEESIPESVPVKTQIVSEDTSPLEDSPETFPPIWCNYEKTLGFDGYAKAMEERGCVFFYFSKRHNMWRTINYTKRSLGRFDVENVGKRWGNRPSKIADESLLKPFLKDEISGTDIFFGKPVTMENKIRRTITEKLKMSGISPSQLVGIRGVYVLSNGVLYLRVKEIVQKEGGARQFLCDVVL